MPLVWKIYYHDRSTFSSGDGDWADAPPWGVMAVVVRDETVGYSRDCNDFYIMSPWGNGQPWACDQWGVLDLLIHLGIVSEEQTISELSPKKLIDAGVKFGRSIKSTDWQEVQNWIHDDPDFGPKSSRWRHERP